MKRKIILLLVTLWISIFIISGCSMMPHLNASAQTVIDTKKELLAEIEMRYLVERRRFLL